MIVLHGSWAQSRMNGQRRLTFTNGGLLLGGGRRSRVQ